MKSPRKGIMIRGDHDEYMLIKKAAEVDRRPVGQWMFLTCLKRAEEVLSEGWSADRQEVHVK